MLSRDATILLVPLFVSVHLRSNFQTSTPPIYLFSIPLSLTTARKLLVLLTSICPAAPLSSHFISSLSLYHGGIKLKVVLLAKRVLYCPNSKRYDCNIIRSDIYGLNRDISHSSSLQRVHLRNENRKEPRGGGWLFHPLAFTILTKSLPCSLTFTIGYEETREEI